MMVSNYTLSTETISLKKQSTSSMKSAITKRCVQPCRAFKKSSIAHSVKLGWILVNKKFISQAQLESVLTIQFRYDKKLGELLVEQKLISRKQLEQTLKEQYWRQNGYWVI